MPKPEERSRILQDQHHDVGSLRTKRHANAQLLGAPVDGVGDEAIEADERKE